MKLLIASDLHGSARDCRSLLTAFHREGADKLLLLGDLLYHGPRNDFPDEYDTRACTALLNGVKDRLLCVRGNCDAEVDQMVLEFPIMADFCYLSIDGTSIYAAHGHLSGPDAPPPLREGEYLLCGHIHLPVCQARQGYTYLNPGSLALPKGGHPKSYMTLEKGVFRWHKLEDGEEFQPLKEI